MLSKSLSASNDAIAEPFCAEPADMTALQEAKAVRKETAPY